MFPANKLLSWNEGNGNTVCELSVAENGRSLYPSNQPIFYLGSPTSQDSGCIIEVLLLLYINHIYNTLKKDAGLQ